MTHVTRMPGHRQPYTVASDVLSNGYWVSTIELADPFIRSVDAFVGKLQQIVPNDRADLSTPGDFETMVFACDAEGTVTDWSERDFARYQTREGAIAGHEEIVERWMAE